MKFIGIDLGWRSQPSGLCCLTWNDQLELSDLDRKETIEDVLNWIDTCVKPNEPAMIAVDAPTIIPNATGMRVPDKLTHKHFGRYHAGCYPANLSLPFAQRTVSFGLELEARGFTHAPTISPQQPGRYQIEVFPHPATINLFNLNRILKYKKGKLAERQTELTKLHQYIVNILPTLQPPLSSLRLSGSFPPGSFPLDSFPPSSFPLGSPPPTTGATLKALEDQLDSLICAYVGAHWWYWGLDRNWVLGDRTTGYIVIPVRV